METLKDLLKTRKGKIWLAVILILALTLFLVLVRGVSGEDNWLCKDGKWQKHGNPSSSMPATECK